jgi:hypothetical protein
MKELEEEEAGGLHRKKVDIDYLQTQANLRHSRAAGMERKNSYYQESKPKALRGACKESKNKHTKETMPTGLPIELGHKVAVYIELDCCKRVYVQRSSKHFN